ncbi:MAG: hypothetical protein ACE5PV_03020 [Candidatus Poribacteria bacterium]
MSPPPSLGSGRERESPRGKTGSGGFPSRWAFSAAQCRRKALARRGRRSNGGRKEGVQSSPRRELRGRAPNEAKPRLDARVSTRAALFAPCQSKNISWAAQGGRRITVDESRGFNLIKKRRRPQTELGARSEGTLRSKLGVAECAFARWRGAGRYLATEDYTRFGEGKGAEKRGLGVFPPSRPAEITLHLNANHRRRDGEKPAVNGENG